MILGWRGGMVGWLEARGLTEVRYRYAVANKKFVNRTVTRLSSIWGLSAAEDATH